MNDHRMARKVLITIWENEVAPRFDLTTEVLISRVGSEGAVEQSKTMVLAHASAEELCQLILNENIDVVICGAIEEEFYDYLIWKKIEVFDSVMGGFDRALAGLLSGELKPGAVLFDRPGLDR